MGTRTGVELLVASASDPLTNSARSDVELLVASERCAVGSQPWRLGSEPPHTEPQSWPATVATRFFDGLEERQPKVPSRGDQASRQPRVSSRGSQESRSPALPRAMPPVVRPPMVLPPVVQPGQSVSPRPWHVRSTSSGAASCSGTGTPLPNPGTKPPAISSLEPYVSLGPGKVS